MGICIGLLGESQSMSPEDRTIAANLLGDAATIATDGGTKERARLLRITEGAIGGVALGDNETIAALFQRHKTELERLRRKAANAGDMTESKAEPARAAEPMMAPKEEPAQVLTNEPARAESVPGESAQAIEPVADDDQHAEAAPASRARRRAPRRKKSVKSIH